MAKKRKAAKPVRLAEPMGRWLKCAAEDATGAEGRTVTVVEVSARLAHALNNRGIHTLTDFLAVTGNV